MSAGLNERRKTDEDEVVGEGEGCGEYGSRGLVKKRDPKMPSEDERREHEMTQILFRDRCRHCVRGQGF